MTWTCPDCGTPFANANASHSCVRIDLDDRFAGGTPEVRAAFDRLVELASVDGPMTVVAQKTRIVLAGPMTVVAQKTRIVLAGPMRFVAVQVHRDLLTGHVLAEAPVTHPAVTEIVPDAYGSGLSLHLLSIAAASQLDDAFAVFIREAADRVGRRKRLSQAAG